MKNADMPAMPVLYAPGQHGKMEQCGTQGMTKREAFAMAAMQGLWGGLTDGNRPQHYQHAAASCVAIADALLSELAKEPT
jgi:hypothetical protein